MSGAKSLTVDELAAKVEVSRRTVMRWLASPSPPPHHKAPGKNGKLTFELPEVVAWMRELGRTGQPGRPPAEVTLLGGGPQAGEASPGRGQPAPARPTAPGCDAGAGAGAGDATPPRDELLRLTAEANLRIKQLEAQKRARQEREADGELHEVAACRARSIARINAVKAVFLILPGKLAERCAMKPYDEVYQVLSEELDAVLRGFAGRS